MVQVNFEGGPWDGQVGEYPTDRATRDIYPFETTGTSNTVETGFYFKHGDEPVWSWVPFTFGQGQLSNKLRELGV